VGGTYLAIVYGFASLRIKDDGLHLNPTIPRDWKSYSFKITYKSRKLTISISKNGVQILMEEGKPLGIFLEPLHQDILVSPGEIKNIYWSH
jgi:alpha,alpha-trehalose phosphorylase